MQVFDIKVQLIEVEAEIIFLNVFVNWRQKDKFLIANFSPNESWHVL